MNYQALINILVLDAAANAEMQGYKTTKECVLLCRETTTGLMPSFDQSGRLIPASKDQGQVVCGLIHAGGDSAYGNA